MLNYLIFCAVQVSKLLVSVLENCFPIIIMLSDKPRVTSIKTPSFYVRILHLVFRLGNLRNQLEKGSFNVRPSDSQFFLCWYNVKSQLMSIEFLLFCCRTRLLIRYNLFKPELQLECLPQLKH